MLAPDKSLTFSFAELHHLHAIVDTYNQTIPGRQVTADLSPVSVESKTAWFFAHHPERRPLWIIESNGSYAGWMSLQDFYGRPAYAKSAEISIYIDVQFRGKGIGKKSLAYAIEQCPALNIENLLGFIFGHNQYSLNLFYTFGFENWGHLPAVAELDGLKRDLVIVGKKIN